jgi:demethylmenaquinone methyltransferase/2-methoxy-6-polyprenyl-1,4-benzoquinol methylase
MTHSDTDAQDTASFGFEQVPRGEKAVRVKEVFDSVAARYDVMNDLMSVGLHRAWKDAAILKLNPQPGETILDIAGGTGDMGRRIVKRVEAIRARRGGASASVTVSDINEDMLEAGKKRGSFGLEWVVADAEALPFPTAQADATIISYGIRNVTDIPQALREMRRVLKPGGRFFCLEFSRLALGGLEPLYDAYSFNVIPAIGQLVTKDGPAYRYLVESIRKFPDQEAFARMIKAAGFKQVGYRNFAGGVTALHWGFVG